MKIRFIDDEALYLRGLELTGIDIENKRLFYAERKIFDRYVL